MKFAMLIAMLVLHSARAAHELSEVEASTTGLMSWDEAQTKARKLLASMTQDEKMSLMRGTGWNKYPFGIGSGWLNKYWYVGNTPAVSRLGIPSLNMMDAAAGFRTFWSELIGTVTCWPSLLALAATWDSDATFQFGQALGEEFTGKGANVLLGPSINVHRVARGGRNFELLSGEDPVLGSHLTTAYVEGVQSKGVATVMKHFIFNNQETNRNSESSNVDKKTAEELYYPPFQAAMKAGTSAAMCSYNKVDGQYSCSNSQQLQKLKQEWGFQGFVMSDWWATHDTSVIAGLDQEMPGTGDYFSTEHLAFVNSFNSSAIDDSVSRILAVMYRLDLFTSAKCSPPDCEGWIRKNVTNKAHGDLARTLATESVVLLKNEGDVLPLSSEKAKTIAVIGSAAIAQPYDNNGGLGLNWNKGDYYSGGGSGHVIAGYVVTPLAGIQQRAAEAGITVLAETTDNAEKAAALAGQVDVAVVVVATTSGEAADRANLNLDHGMDSLVSKVAAKAKKTIVIAQIPGAVLMPWRDEVSSIAAMFLGGQETGSAWAAVLFGDHAPSGNLPVMLPATEADQIPPSGAAVVPYTEGMETSYRNPNFAAAFPFGHGLTYTTFEYGSLARVQCEVDGALCLEMKLQNTGKVAAKSLAQLYLEFPPGAEYPAPLLRSFYKTKVLEPGAEVTVTFPLTTRDISFFDTASSKWVQTSTVIAHVGTSSADIRQSMSVSLTTSDIDI